jgi:chaperonin GroES
MNLKPTGNRILVKTLKQETERLEGGIIVLDTGRGQQKRGIVTALGSGEKTASGNIVPFDVKIGDEVILSQYVGTEIKYEGENYVLVTSEEIFGVVEKE